MTRMENPAEAKTILLAPHNDDEALFASFICMREKPLVIVATDSWRQFKRGEKEITAERRRNESTAAMKLLGCAVHFLGIPDNQFDRKELLKKLGGFHPELVYAPAVQGGNKQHDIVGAIALELFDNVIQYSTYSKKALYTTGEIEIIPTPEELALKERALACYKSQIEYVRTAPHFTAVRGKSEWITKHIRHRYLQILWSHWTK